MLGRTELRYGSDQIARRHSVHVLKLKTYDVIEVERMPSECCYFFCTDESTGSNIRER